jgi:antirestriction protein ArdC
MTFKQAIEKKAHVRKGSEGIMVVFTKRIPRDDDDGRAARLAALGASSDLSYEATIERTLDDLAAHLSRHIDLDALLRFAR